jgi:LuxR family maltose regulon positive regulatory protein
MASPLVETKLFIPRLRRNAVPRPRLSDRLCRGAEAKLTLISAPAGFGKTTLLAEWLAGAAAHKRSVAWLSLEENDSQPASFWTYVTTALQTAVPGIGADALPLLQSPQPQVATFLATMLNELSGVSSEVDLVLDDYHLADGPDIAAGMTFLLEHLPPNAHLIISTRADPQLPLARLRARGELAEVRSADLRFTPDEVADYLNRVTALNLTAHDIATLESRTEGWIAALQLAALSIHGREDVGGFIASFAGDDRYIVDYLVEEVLSRQPDPVRNFLVSTSILDRLSGPLCDAVTEQQGGKAMLESLDRANLFVVPLDERRHWYRYHHLFADVLHTHLVDERADEVPGLHRRASQWYEQHGETSPAVRHALAAGDAERAAALIELAIPGLRRTRQDAILRAWVDVIPEEVVRVRPVLGVAFIGALMSSGEFDDVERRLRDAERWLDTTGGAGHEKPPTSSSRMVVVDHDQLRRLPGAMQMYRAALALARGDVAGTVEHAQLAMDRAAEDDHLTRAGASALSGLASWGSGDLDAAHRAYSAAVEGMQRAGHIADILGCSITLADIRITQGRLSEALATYERALLLASRETGTVLRGTADMYVGLSQIACERNDLDAATTHLQRSHELGEHTGLPQNPYRWRVAMARVREARGNVAGALALLEDAQRVYTGDFSPNVRPIPALRAGLLATHGYVDDALTWAREQGLSADDDLSYLREFEHITLAKVLLSQYTATGVESSIADAVRLLERLLAAAEAGDRTGSVIEVLVLQALTHDASGDTGDAVAVLERALTLAEPEGYVRVFVGEGPPMASLLRVVAQQRVGWDYIHRLVDACSHDEHRTLLDRDTAPAGRAQRRARQGLVEPLSERELDVLRLLRTELDGPAIARELIVSLNTLRTHTKSIYAKLGVSSRRAAVRRAEELGLLSRTGGR